jgi:3-oxoacyl-[acyl-carrier protein] reductase
MARLSGKVALVTGAASGLGAATARRLAKDGAAVLLTDRDLAGEDIAASITAAGGQAAFRLHDVTSHPDWAAAVEHAVHDFGRLDILVANAGITRDNLAMRMKDDEWADVIRINLEATFRLYRAAAKPMMKQRFGRMIAITSVVGVTGNPGQANYAASKAGLIGMSKALAQELASRNITVNCVAPGFILSAMTDALPDAQKDALTGRIPAGRLGEGADIAAGVVYLASKEASYVTGHTLHINGGMAMP